MNAKLAWIGGLRLAVAAVGLLAPPARAEVALGTAFTYQGQLRRDGAPVNGPCDFEFRLWDAATAGAQVGATQSVTGHAVTNGLFTVQLDFGQDAFNGDARWLEIAAKAPGEPGHTTLSPRQPLTPAPYALFALAAPWSGLSGIPAGFADGIDDDTTYRAGTGITLAGTTFSLNTAYTDARYWGLSGNAGTNPSAQFLGTTDNVALELRVQGARTLRLEPHATSPSVIGGHSANSVTAGVYGATVGGGGNSTSPNRVTDAYGTVGGGAGNQAGDNAGSTADAPRATVGGGLGNTASGPNSTVAGGAGNTAGGVGAAVGGGELNTASTYATIGGGWSNDASASSATVGGGYDNAATDRAATVAGGENNVASQDVATVGGGGANEANAVAATVGGGSTNVARGSYTTVAGGHLNTAFGLEATVGGGRENTAGGYYATVAGGLKNTANGDRSTVGGGDRNSATRYGSTISGGVDNTATGYDSTVGGGRENNAGEDYVTVAGGYLNAASAQYATVGGGHSNSALGYGAIAPGGIGNTAGGRTSFAAGRQAKTSGNGSFVWADDSSTSPFTISANNRFAARTAGGVYFYTTSDLSTYAYLPAGSGSWVPSSDHNVKADIEPVQPQAVLRRLAAVPISTWRYQGEDDAIRHMGPMAQDLYAAFGLGHDDKGISTVDADGVALAAIQGLHQIVEEKDAEVADLRQQLADKAAKMTQMEERLAKLEALVDARTK